MENKVYPFFSVRQVLDYVVHCSPCRQIYKDQLNRDNPSREPRFEDPAHLWMVCMTVVRRVHLRATPLEWRAFEWRFLTKLAEPTEKTNYSKGQLVRAIAHRLGRKKSTIYSWTDKLLEFADIEAAKLELIPPRGKYGT